MIYFYEELLDKSLEIIKSVNTYQDVKSDLLQINTALNDLQMPQSYKSLCRVQQLDSSMRRKYPTIQNMCSIAAQMEQALPATTQQNHSTCSQQELLTNTMKQDRIGIIVDTGIREGMAREIKDFIKEVT